MMTAKQLISTAAGLLLLIGSARGDWNVGDPYKYVQLPNMNGWDVSPQDSGGAFTMLADDWVCSVSGPVTDIHLWYSWSNDVPHNFGVELAIYSNVPGVGTNGFSQPGNSLWSSVFNWGQFSTRPYATNSQGWYEPRTGSWLTNTHSIMWELNITNIQNLNQQQGVTYWLAVEFTGTNTDTIGWKTALTSTNDAAVWLTPSWVWTKLVDQSTNSMDLAFVITTIPEPSTSLLVALGGLALIGLRRQVARH